MSSPVAAVLGPILLATLLHAPETSGLVTLPKGEIVPRVVCEGDPEETYAAYVPTSYDPGKPSPILYLLDARRRGTTAAEAFRAAAESSGWILASSNNSESDGPFLPNVRAMRAMWDDTRARFSIDPRRVYATGFSGGARAACVLAQTAAKGQIAGVIGCGAGFPDNAPPTRGLPFAFFGAVGNADFNYREMRELDRTLASLGAAHRLAIFDGPHGWPPPEVCGRAVRWMELAAMRGGLRPRDEPLVAGWLALASREAAALETAGRKGEALARYREVAEDFEGLADSAAVRAPRDRLEKDGGAAPTDRGSGAPRAGRRTRRSPTCAAELFADLRSEDPCQPARGAGPAPVGAAPQRGVGPGARPSVCRRPGSAPRSSFRPPSIWRASTSSAGTTGVRSSVRRGAARWPPIAPARSGTTSRACRPARETKAALATLRKAVEKGFRDADQMESDPDLEKVRAEDGYRQIVDGLRSPSGRP